MMKRSALTALASIYLLGLWIYQLPVSPVERILMKIFAPAQTLSFTNRQYRMYAPGPRSRKRVAFVLLKTSLSPVKFYRPFRGLAGGERWSNFFYHLSKSLSGEWENYPPEEGRRIFRRFALGLCNQGSQGSPKSNDLERLKTVSLQTRLVDFSDFQGDIVWDPPEEMETVSCYE